jgi:hypothetical protein
VNTSAPTFSGVWKIITQSILPFILVLDFQLFPGDHDIGEKGYPGGARSHDPRLPESHVGMIAISARAWSRRCTLTLPSGCATRFYRSTRDHGGLQPPTFATGYFSPRGKRKSPHFRPNASRIMG